MSRLIAIAVLCAASWAFAAPIKFVVNITDADGVGFKDATKDPRTNVAFGMERTAALQYAANIWGKLLVASYANETITIDATMISLAKPDKLTNDTLASASPIEKFTNFIPDGAKPTNPAYAKDTSYGSALANHLKGSDLNPDKSEISTSFNIDLDNADKFPDNHWYYGTDGKPDKGGFDFVTTALHEICHGLDFLTRAFSLPPPQDSGGFVGGIPSAMDRFDIVGSTGKLLTSLDPFIGLQGAVISNDVFFNGPTAKAANGGKAVKLFDPTTFQAGSSMSHLDSSVGTDLMLPGGSDVFTTPTDIDLGILTDIGWTIIPEPSSLLLMLPMSALLLCSARKRR